MHRVEGATEFQHLWLEDLYLRAQVQVGGKSVCTQHTGNEERPPTVDMVMDFLVGVVGPWWSRKNLACPTMRHKNGE